MGRNKPLALKLRLAKAGKQKKAVPTWVMMRTMGRVRRSPKNQRNWRRVKLRA
ncbi:50S ribosomal protein L39e [Candidatus Bathyarchaeota archaeon]|nr:50S ribosomal protein L39e [Candidatus Bathyarchaeota archaeon]RJS89910.1 MAG: 50S ribosomal protein L39e [Candidatus Bathyarchaeota archaeon]RLI33399.1 MAG: 50S ribosomal protein L39e [Candidatus Bathyarchaeota archaeon]